MGGATDMRQDGQQDGAQEAFVPSDRKRFTIRCPHCLCDGIRRSSREITPTFREIFYICPNVTCGHTWVASLNYEYGLSPSAIPDPAVNLPLRPMERIPGVTIRAATDPPPEDTRQINLFD